MKANLEKIFKKVMENSGKAKRYLVIIPALRHSKFYDSVYYQGLKVWAPGASDIIVPYHGKEFTVSDDFYGYDGEKNDRESITKFLDQFGFYDEQGPNYSFRVWFKELMEDGAEQGGGAGGSVAQVYDGGSGQLQRHQCGECACSDSETEEAAEEPGRAFLQPEKAAEPALSQA